MSDIFGFIKVGVGVPNIKIGNPMYNVREIKSIADEISFEGKSYGKSGVIVFPELCITGYTCGDLFNQSSLINEAEKALGKLIPALPLNCLVVVGLPVRADNQLFNSAVVIYRNRILGVVPKTFMPNYNEFYEKRHFASSETRISDKIKLCGQEVPFGENILFKDVDSGLCLGIDICEDLWVNIPPSSYHTLYGANLILNLSASNECVTKADYRRDIVRIQSAKCLTAYAYVSAGQSESTTDLVFSGHSIIAENGSILKEGIFGSSGESFFSYIDIEKLTNDRIKFNSYMGRVEKRDYRYVEFSMGYSDDRDYDRKINAAPFVPSKKEEREKRCKEIMNMQAIGLYQRLSKTGINKAFIGISGGLDSTLALLVTVEAFKKLNLPMTNIFGVTMPGFGTTGRTYKNAISMMKELGITIKEISIKDACIQHFKDIGQDENVHDITYENVQARERTKILMDLANKEGGLVVGTGDLSELALGWCTYNGDHMSMYGVNASIPKTLVRYLVKWYAETTANDNVKEALLDVCDTPVSPELLPPDKEGKIAQVTEDTVGPYELHDFFLYNMMRNGFSPTKIFFLASKAFEGKYEKEVILKWIKMFYKRFFSQQFKRSCMPDGVKVGSICLSPRGDWRMPSDASYELWTSELEAIDIKNYLN